MLTQEQLAETYRQACEVELQAFKPGNVSIYSAAHDMTVDDFRVSATVSAPALTNPDYTLGEKIYYAVRATRDAVACNTNLGIILLSAPLLQAAMNRKAGQSLRQAVTDVINNTSIADAQWVFQAIALAAPAGLGQSEQQDVNQTAQVTLTEAMTIASERDRIASQYTHFFKDIFDFAIMRYNHGFVWSGHAGWAALTVFCELLACYPDSHIERKYGTQYSDWLKAEMILLCNDIQVAKNPEVLLPKLTQLDKTLKAKKINPGTTADLTVAAVLVVFLEQLITHPA